MARKRTRAKIGDKRVGNYFLESQRETKFVSSGGTLLDCILSGGWAQSRIINIVGDKSTAKTGLAMEAITNFARTVPKIAPQYVEIESAFDKGYAEAMGLPLDRVEFPNDPDGDSDDPKVETVEDLFEWMRDYIKGRPRNEPGLVVVDSLDALSDRAEIQRDIDEGTYGGNKAKKMSELFRRLNQHISRSSVTVIIISQTRDKIGVTFGPRYSRSGGRALDFYASQVVLLARIKTIKRTVKGVERPIGVAVRAKVEKNKVGLALRECDFRYMFGWGIDDTTSCLDWLVDVGRHEELGLPKAVKAARAEITKKSRGFDNYDPEFAQKVVDVTRRVWREIEQQFIPTSRKYDA